MSFFFEPGSNCCMPRRCMGCEYITPYINADGVAIPWLVQCTNPDATHWIECPNGNTPERIQILNQCKDCKLLDRENDGHTTWYFCACENVPAAYMKRCTWDKLPDLGKICAFRQSRRSR